MKKMLSVININVRIVIVFMITCSIIYFIKPQLFLADNNFGNLAGMALDFLAVILILASFYDDVSAKYKQCKAEKDGLEFMKKRCKHGI